MIELPPTDIALPPSDEIMELARQAAEAQRNRKPMTPDELRQWCADGARWICRPDGGQWAARIRELRALPRVVEAEVDFSDPLL